MLIVPRFIFVHRTRGAAANDVAGLRRGRLAPLSRSKRLMLASQWGQGGQMLIQATCKGRNGDKEVGRLGLVGSGVGCVRR